MYCTKCGHQLSDNASVCLNCGTAVNSNPVKQKKAKKPIFKRWWFWLIVAFIAIAAIGGSGSSDEPTPVDPPSITTTDPAENKDTEEVTEEATEEVTEAPTEADTATTGEKNALRAANNYLNFTAFSYNGLIDQLKFEGYTAEEAKYGADHCGADWMEQAVKSAESYLEYSAFSREGLIDQLEFEGFTHEQAVYGVEQNGY